MDYRPPIISLCVSLYLSKAVLLAFFFCTYPSILSGRLCIPSLLLLLPTRDLVSNDQKNEVLDKGDDEKRVVSMEICVNDGGILVVVVRITTSMLIAIV